jgi:hypothetical protein
LICQGFGIHPDLLWITLLISASDTPGALENQGFGWIARKKGKVQNPYKSTTWSCYFFGSAGAQPVGVLGGRDSRFVYKSALFYAFTS